MLIKNGRLWRVIGLLGAACVPVFASADVVTFRSNEVNLGQGGGGIYRTAVAGSEWAPFGLALANVSLYTSPFDPVDGVGIVGEVSGLAGAISFLTPATTVSLDVLQGNINSPAVVRAYRPDGTLLQEQLLGAVSQATVRVVGFEGVVGRVEFSPSDFTAVSTVRFTSVPGPGVAASMVLGLAGLQRRRRSHWSV